MGGKRGGPPGFEKTFGAGSPTRGEARAVIWDFDGVILDNELLHLEAELETVRAFGLPLTREIALEYLGVRLEDYFRDLLVRFGAPRETLDAMLAVHCETLRRYYRELFPLSPHMREVLELLKGRCPMGVSTNRERELLSLSFARHRLDPYFKCVVCKEDVRKGKPDPEPYLEAARLLDVDARRAVAVEDTETGFRAAKEAGMTIIARKAAHNAHLDFSVADYLVEDLREIPRILSSP